LPEYYYSTQPFLAWCLNHYFYGGMHYVNVANPFYPYRLPNPKSSHPFLIYQDLYLPWKDRDDFDKFIQQIRLDLNNGVVKYNRANPGKLSGGRVSRLKRICKKVDIVFFYPMVYRVDINPVPTSRLVSAGSGLSGSREHLINDLQEKEFDILFHDFNGDPDFDSLKDVSASISDTAALRTLESRC